MAEKEEAADLVKTRVAFWITGKYDPRDYSFENFKRCLAWIRRIRACKGLHFFELLCPSNVLLDIGEFSSAIVFSLVVGLAFLSFQLVWSECEASSFLSRCTLSSFNKMFSLTMKKLKIKICDDRFC